MGLVEDIDDWRRERGLSSRDVVAVSTTNRHGLRGLSGCFEVIALESWERASLVVKAAVVENLRIVRATSPPCPGKGSL